MSARALVAVDQRAFTFSPSSTRRHFTQFLLEIFVAKLVRLILQQNRQGK